MFNAKMETVLTEQFNAAMGIGLGALLQLRREQLQARLRRDDATRAAIEARRGKPIPVATDKSRRVVVDRRNSQPGD